MDIRNFHGVLPFLMNEADGGEGGGGGGGSVAVAEPGTAIVPSGDTSVATTDDSGASPDATGDDTALTTSGDRGGSKPANPALALLKDHADPEVKKFANTAIRAIAARQELGKLFPGVSPIAAVKTLQSDMISLAGRHYNTPDPKDPERRTGIQQIRDRMAEFEEVDLLYYSGDPRILDGMTADDEGKASFAKLAPAMMAKFREIAPNAYASSIAKLFLGSMKYDMLTNEKGEPVEEADIPLRLRRLYAAIPEENALARAELNALSNFVWRIQEMAKLAPEVFTKEPAVNAKNDERERRLAERENRQREQEWGSARQIMADQSATKLWKQLTKGHEISATDEEDVQSLFRLRFDKSIQAKEPNADERRKSYLAADDREGYLAYEKYLMDTYGIPALKTETARMLARLTPAKPGQRAAAPAVPGAQPAQPTPQGFIKIASKPMSHELDYTKMTDVMVRNKQGILRGGNSLDKPAGTRVCW